MIKKKNIINYNSFKHNTQHRWNLINKDYNLSLLTLYYTN